MTRLVVAHRLEQRDIGRLARFTFDMGGTGELLSLALNVPPWEDLHELSRAELRSTNLVTTDLLPKENAGVPMAGLNPKPVQDRFVSVEGPSQPAKSTKTAAASVPTGDASTAAPTLVAK